MKKNCSDNLKTASVTQKYLNLKDISEILGVTEQTVKTYIDNGEIVSFEMKRFVRVIPADFARFVNARRMISVPDEP